MKIEIKAYSGSTEKDIRTFRTHTKDGVTDPIQFGTALPSQKHIAFGVNDGTYRLYGQPAEISDIKWDFSIKGGMTAMSFNLATDPAFVALAQGDRIVLRVVGSVAHEFVGFVDSITKAHSYDEEKTKVSVVGYCRWAATKFTVSGADKVWEDANFITATGIDRTLASYVTVLFNGIDYESGATVVSTPGLASHSPLSLGSVDLPNTQLKLTFSGEDWFTVLDKIIDLANGVSGGYNYGWSIDPTFLRVNIGPVTRPTLNFTLPSAPYRIAKYNANLDIISSFKPSDRSRNKKVTNYLVKTKNFTTHIPALIDGEHVVEKILDLTYMSSTLADITPIVNNFLFLDNLAGDGGSIVIERASAPYGVSTINVTVEGELYSYSCSTVSYSVEPSGVTANINLGEDRGGLLGIIQNAIQEKYDSGDNDGPNINFSLGSLSRSMSNPSYIGGQPEFFIQPEETNPASKGVKGIALGLKRNGVRTLWIQPEIMAVSFRVVTGWDVDDNPIFANLTGTTIESIDGADYIILPEQYRIVNPPPIAIKLDFKPSSGYFYNPEIASGEIVSFVVKAIDGDNNVSTLSDKEYTVDKEPPTASLSTKALDSEEDPSAQSYSEVTGRFKLYINATDKSRITLLEIERGDKYGNNFVLVAATIEWDATEKKWFWVSPARSGKYTLRVKVTDEWGNFSYSDIMFLNGVRKTVNSTEVAGTTTEEKVTDIVDDDGNVIGTKIAPNSIGGSAFTDPSFIDAKVRLTAEDTLVRKRFTFNRSTGSLEYLRYPFAQFHSSADTTVAGAAPLVGQTEGTRIFEVDDNGFATGLKAQAFFTEG